MAARDPIRPGAESDHGQLSRWAGDLLSPFSARARYHNLAQQPVGFLLGPGREDQLVRLGGVAVAEPQAPQAIDGDRIAVRLPKLTEVITGDRVVGVDVTVAEVADEQRPAERAETLRCESEAPGRVQRATGDESADEGTVVGEDVHETVAGASDIVVQRRVLFGVTHVQLARDFLDAERPVARGQPRVNEQPAWQLDRLEVAVVSLDPARTEVGGVQIGLTVGRLGDGEALVNRV